MASLGMYGYSLYYDSHFKTYIHEDVSSYDSLSCQLDHMSSYDMMAETNYLDKVKISFDEKQDNPVKYNFKGLKSDTVDVIFSDSIGIDESTVIKVADTDAVIQLVGVVGLGKDTTVTYTIYKKSGFLTYTRSGSIAYVIDGITAGFGHCY